MRTSKTRRVLVIDIGGSHVKMRMSGHRDMLQFVSGPDLTPAAMVKGVRELTAEWNYTAVSIGYPGIVIHGKIVIEPHVRPSDDRRDSSMMRRCRPWAAMKGVVCSSWDWARVWGRQ
jgi:hypothetical protein